MVEHFDAHLLGAALTTQSAGCGDSATFSDLTPDQSYDFEVFAFESGASSPRWGTTCFRKAQAGATLDAGCDPLTEDSSIRVPSSVVSATLGISCSDISEVTGLLDGSDKKTVPCGGISASTGSPPRPTTSPSPPARPTDPQGPSRCAARRRCRA
ncbi:MAG: hypothetical protein H6717_09455 [Polyangiaceae bacterium]|nr:hypothetical protein [Polyangiaceae bacterium]